MAILVACLMCMGHCQRLPALTPECTSASNKDKISPLRALSLALLTSSPSVALQVSLPAHMRGGNFEAVATSAVLNSKGVLLIDVDNVRGKSHFGLSQLSLLTRTARWAQRRQLAGSIVLVVDHGSRSAAYHMPRLAGISVVFAGPQATADDVVVRGAEWLQRQGHNVLLVTEDSGLISRCHDKCRDRAVYYAKPKDFLRTIGFTEADIGTFSAEYEAASRSSSGTNTTPPLSKPQLEALELEMRARTALIRSDRRKIWHRSSSDWPGCRQRLCNALSTALSKEAELKAPCLADVLSVRASLNVNPTSTEVMGSNVELAAVSQLSTDAQEAIMAALIRRGMKRRARLAEDTYDRVVLAEVFRRRLERRSRHEAAEVLCPAAAYAAMFNNMTRPDVACGPLLLHEVIDSGEGLRVSTTGRKGKPSRSARKKKRRGVVLIPK